MSVIRKVHVIESDEEFRLDLVSLRLFGQWTTFIESTIMELNPEVNFFELITGVELLLPTQEEVFRGEITSV